jgi:HTH-type transcriptional regulator / antitoxin HipB
MVTRTSQSLVTAAQLGLLLKNARKGRGLTQTDVAGRVGLSQNRVSHLESHPDELSVKQLLAWCAVVGLQLDLSERRTESSKSKAEW